MNPSDQEIDERLGRLTRHATPPERVWTAVAKELQPARKRLLASMGMAAAAVLCVVVFLDRLGPDKSSAGPWKAGLAPFPATTNWQPVSIEQAGLSAPWHANQRAIEALEQALQDDPGNRMLQEFLANARLRQAELIRVSTRNAPMTSI